MRITGRVVVIADAAGGMGAAIPDGFLAKRNPRAIRRTLPPRTTLETSRRFRAVHDSAKFSSCAVKEENNGRRQCPAV
jgi:hypothetical protein